MDNVEALLAEFRTAMTRSKTGVAMVEKLTGVPDARIVSLLLEVAAGCQGADTSGWILPTRAEQGLVFMGQTTPSLVTPILLATISDHKAVGRVQAARVLSKIKPDSDNEFFMHLLEEDDSSLVAEAVKVLGKRGYRPATPVLLKVLKRGPIDGKDYHLHAIIEVLGQMADPHVVPDLTALLSINNNNGLEADIIKTLAKIGSPEAFEPMLQFILDIDSLINTNTRRYTYWLLSTGSLAKSLAATAGAGSTERLVALLGDGKSRHQELAVECLRIIGGGDTALPLLQVAQRLSQKDSANRENLPVSNFPIDPFREGTDAHPRGAGPVLVALYEILKKSITETPATTLMVLAEMGPIVAEVYFVPPGDAINGTTEIHPLKTEKICELAKSELNRREGR